MLIGCRCNSAIIITPRSFSRLSLLLCILANTRQYTSQYMNQANYHQNDRLNISCKLSLYIWFIYWFVNSLCTCKYTRVGDSCKLSPLELCHEGMHSRGYAFHSGGGNPPKKSASLEIATYFHLSFMAA